MSGVTNVTERYNADTELKVITNLQGLTLILFDAKEIGATFQSDVVIAVIAQQDQVAFVPFYDIPDLVSGPHTIPFTHIGGFHTLIGKREELIKLANQIIVQRATAMEEAKEQSIIDKAKASGLILPSSVKAKSNIIKFDK